MGWDLGGQRKKPNHSETSGFRVRELGVIYIYRERETDRETERNRETERERDRKIDTGEAYALQYPAESRRVKPPTLAGVSLRIERVPADDVVHQPQALPYGTDAGLASSEHCAGTMIEWGFLRWGVDLTHVERVFGFGLPTYRKVIPVSTSVLFHVLYQ